ncbi:hypothetical protein Vretimale_11124 [Volvox reticuliferus]|uniref:SBP-type domain-containing protein n=1 Tax=Volvox reticuliferus TaxID=1737510 RepID=A0A8J4GFX4_9CHLO|nr:hypothetical protein Vretifemale_12846 [Volvox reticuliferus]GIM06882.1 hypothetical protein Vretimale_11124 [Volvox reticuliferus]
MKGVETGWSETQEPLEAAKDLPVISTNHVDANYPQSVAGYRRSSAPLRCKVSGCTSDLASAPKTHQRFRLCNLHIKSPAILVDGVASRFCQQCSRFHPLTEFHGTNRTCRMMLVKNRARQRGVNPYTSLHDASAVPTAWKQSATSPPLRVFHAAADPTAMSATATPANMDAAAASAAGWGGAPHAPTLTQPSGCVPTDWQLARARSVGLATAAAGAAVAAISCPAAVGPLMDKPSLLEVQLPEGRPCSAPPVSPNCSSGASSEHPPAPCPSALTAQTATAAAAADVRPSELPGLQNVAGAGGPSPSLEGLRSANQPQTLLCTDSKSYKAGTVAIMPSISPPSVPCNPALLVSEGAPSIPQTSSVFAVDARCGDGVSIMAAEAGLGPGAGPILSSQADTAMTTAAAMTGAFTRSPSDGTAVTLAAISTRMATSPVNAIAPKRDLCIGPELKKGVPDRDSLQNAPAAPPGTLASMTPSGGPFARCSAPPALCQPDWDNVGGQTLDMLRHWQRQMERDPDQLPPPQLQEEPRPWLHPFQGMRLARGPSAPQWERPSLQRILLLKQTSSSLRTRGDLHAASTSHVYGGGGPDGDGSGLSGSDGDLSWCSIANSTATLGGDERGGVGIGGGGSCNDNGVLFGGSGGNVGSGGSGGNVGSGGSGGNVGSGGNSGSGSGLMFGRMSAPPPDTVKLQTDFRCSTSSSLLVSSTSVAALGCGPSALGALRETGGGGGGIWGLQRAGSFGNFKRRRSLGLEAAADDAAASVRHCSNAGLVEPALDGAVVAVMSGAVDKGLGEHLCLGPQVPVSSPPQGMAALPSSQPQQAVATMMRGLEETPNMLARCAPAGQNNNDNSNNNMPTAELWPPTEVCLQNSGSLANRGCRGGRFGNSDDATNGRGCSAGDGCASPSRQRCKPRWTHTVAEGHGIRNPSSAVALAVEATTPQAVTTDGGGGLRGDGAQLTPRGMASLVLGALALDEEMRQGAILTKAASSGAEAGAACNAVAAHGLGTVHDTATGVTGSLSPVNGDSLLFASLAAEWQGEGEPDSADELLLGLDDAAAGSQIRCRHVEIQPQPQPQPPSMATMVIQQQQPQQMVQQQQQQPAIITEPLGPGLVTTECTSTSAMASAFVRSSTAAGWWSQSSFPGPSQKATEATAAMRREIFLAPDLEMIAASGPTPMVKPSMGVIVEGGGPGRLVPGAQHIWFRSAQSEPAWGSRPSDIVCQQQQQQSPHYYRQHRLGQPSQPLPQQHHQLQHQQAAQHSGCNMEDGVRTASDSASGGALEGACDGCSEPPCRQQQDDSGAGTSSGMSGRKAIGEETEEQLQLLLGDLIGSDMPSQPWPAVAVAAAAQPAQLLPTLAPTSSLLQQMQQQYCGLPLPRLQAMDVSPQPPSPPLPMLQLQQSQQQKGPLVAESGAGSGSGSWAANMCVESSDMLIDYPSQFVSAPVAVSGGSFAGAGCGSSATTHKTVLSPSSSGADAARHGLQVGQQQQQQQHPDLHQHQHEDQQQRLPGRHEGLWLRDEPAIAEVIMADTAAASQSESLEAVPCTAAALASTAIASGGSTPTPCVRSPTTRDAFDGVVSSSYGPPADFRHTTNHPLSSQQQTLQQEKQQQHVSSGHSGSSTRHSRRSHRCTNSARHDGVTRHDQDFLDKALQQQQQMWSELRTMQAQQRALLEQQLEQQRALAKLLGGALPVTAGSTAAASGAGAAAAASAAAVTAIIDGVGCVSSSSAAAAAAKTIANTSSLLEAWQKQRQQDDEQVQGGGRGGSGRSLLSCQRPAVAIFGRSSMSVLRDGGNVENMPSMEERDWQVQLQQLGTRLQQRQGEPPDDLQPHLQEHHHELPLHGNCHGRLQFTRHSHHVHQPHEQHHQNSRPSSLRGVSSPAVLLPANPEGHVLSGGCSGGVSSCT